MKIKPICEIVFLYGTRKKCLLHFKLLLCFIVVSSLNVYGSLFSQNIESQNTSNYFYTIDYVANSENNENFNDKILQTRYVANKRPREIMDYPVLLAPGIDQERVVTGTVTDRMGEPIIGATIVVQGTTIGAVTDALGNFELTVPPDATSLVFSFVGMTTVVVSIGDEEEFNIILDEDIIGLEEVVAIGYGSVTRSDLTGSVSSISGNNIGFQVVSNPVLALAGLAPGVQILQTSGQPGASVSINIRGPNSLAASNEPLFVVDGFPIMGDINSLNTNDIESIEILKDASATAIYGSRGANGVILVTTKKGREGVTSIQYNGSYGIQQVARTIDMLNAQEFATLANIRAANDGMNPYFTESEIAAFGEGTDWQSEIFRIAPIQNHSLGVSGGGADTQFSISGSYFDQEGIIINSGYRTLQLRANLLHHINPNWLVSLNSILNNREFNNIFSQNTERGQGVLDGGVVTAPTLSPYDQEGNYTNVRAYPFSPDISENPVALARERRQLATNRGALLNLFAEGNILESLTIFSSIGIEYDVRRGDFYSPSIFQPTATGSAQTTYAETISLINENHLTYSLRINENHNLRLLGGISAEQRTFQNLGASSTGFLSDVLQNYALQVGNTPGTPNSVFTDYTILSYLGRINYSYRNRYLFTSSFRADGSSRFGRENRWGYFPSAAFAWRVSEEDFWQTTNHNLKLRASWGRTGNTAVSPYQSLTTLASQQVVFDRSIYIGYAPGTIMPNPDLKWETTNQIDVGADIGLFNNRLFIILDYYRKETYDLLAQVPVILSTGYGTQFTNLGDTENRGFEASFDSRIIDRSVLRWNLGLNFSANRNKVVRLPGGADVFGSSLGNVLPAMSIVREGYPIGSFYGYVEDGLNENGSIRYVDFTGSGSITPDDRRIIGDPNPDYIIGVNSNLSYRNFDFAIFVNAIQGVDILNYNISNVSDGFSFGLNQTRDVLGNYWTAENPDPNAKYPRISQNTRYLGSDRYIEDGSYIQLSNIKISYTLRGGRFLTSPFYNSQVYINVQNLYTFTNYSFFTPIMNTRGSGISRGIDQFGYPDARQIIVGFNINI
jgi:TonB-dependent starch-binding outer membrane protein SusC